MRALMVLAALVSAWLVVASAHAQNTDRRVAVLRQAAPPANLQFRLRSNEERLATLNRLLPSQRQRTAAAVTVNRSFTVANLASSFALTSRDPYQAGQGSLALLGRLTTNPDYAPGGDVFFRNYGENYEPVSSEFDAGAVELRLAVHSAHRLLIDCTTYAHASPFNVEYVPGGGQPTWTGPVAPYQNLLSFLTPPIPASLSGEQVRITVRGAETVTINNGAGGWGLLGCQVTRLSAP